MGLMALLWSWVMGCDASSLEVGTQELNIEMYASGVNAPEGATGNDTPEWQKYTLKGVSFLNADGSDPVVLFDGATPETFQIIDRPQIIYNTKIKTYSEKSFAGITLTFDATVTGANSKKSEYSFTLTNPVLTKSEQFTVSKGKGVTLKIMTNWRNTILDGVMSEPQFDLTLKI
jgi:asparagine N-glycosylation enzyme membrane subunit Stt3